MAARFGIEELDKFFRETSGVEDLGLNNEGIVFMRESAQTSACARAEGQAASPRSAVRERRRSGRQTLSAILSGNLANE